MAAAAPRLERFKQAQEDAHAGYAVALKEIQAGAKRSHWIWYIFPQLAGLGASHASAIYGIDGVPEASAYLRDPDLSGRLLTITTAVRDQLKGGVRLPALMGSHIDALKLVSSLTLFEHAARTLQAAEGGGIHGTLAAIAHEVLDIAEAEGYARCRYTLDVLRGDRGTR